MAYSTDKQLVNNDVRSLVFSHASMSLGEASWVKTVRPNTMANKYHSCERLGCYRIPTETVNSALKLDLVESNVE